MALIDSFSAYAKWRADLVVSVQRLRTWLSNNEIGDAQIDLRLQCVLDRLREDKLVVAFVAEFSRGKSELINAIFFSQYGNRVLPSSAGRTTMCPTELQWEQGQHGPFSHYRRTSAPGSQSPHTTAPQPRLWDHNDHQTRPALSSECLLLSNER